ncbi:MAG: hypothetical protein K0S65_4847, partial [Labilithrix sp.]|nr:hypothetical protein [Labilithrix sp.]
SLHLLCERLLRQGEPTNVVHETLAELAEQLSQHVDAEERHLAPPRLRELISAEGLLAVAREAEALRRRWLVGG